MSPFYTYVVTAVFNEGLGYGNSDKPSFDEQAAAVGKDFVAAIKNLLVTGHILAPIDHLKDGGLVDDDGCGDGRAAVTVFEGQVKHRFSLNRPKVFGGGAMMSTAMHIGLGYALGENLKTAFQNGIDLLDKHDMNYGAHIDNHSTGGNSGCGAIDNAPLVLKNIVRYREKIKQTVLDLDLGVDEAKIEAVLDNFAAYAKSVANDAYEGAEIVQAIIKRGKVVKELDGGHKEIFILLNDVPNTTADQSLIRDVTNGTAQLFDVDLWRLKQLSNALYGATMEAEDALVSEVVYTLGVAATLTRGDLPVFLAQPKETPLAAAV